MRVILDGMGSDDHPTPEITAAITAAKMFGDEIILTGNKAVLEPLLAKENKNNAPVRIVDAPETFSMTDKISGSVLRKGKNSMGVGMDMIKNNEADVIVTAGNTGGAMAIGLARLGRIKGVKRPGLSAPFPVKGGHCLVSDIGANVECKPEYLLQFAIMGSEYVQHVLGVASPRVGLISNGEEAGKGNELVKETYPILEKSKLNFVGNIEGKELFGGEVDVAITDGFTGNVILKTSEAASKLMSEILKESLMSTIRTKIGAVIAKPAFDAMKKKLDPNEIGAVPLLGLGGLVFIAHGRSNAKALTSAIQTARQAVAVDLMDKMRTAIANALEKE